MLSSSPSPSPMPSECKASSSPLKKLIGAGNTLLGRGFSASKCKTEVKLATARIKLLRNKKEPQLKKMRRDVAMLLQNGQDPTARIRVEHVIREQNIMTANEIIELFCELVVARLAIIEKERDCPADLREGISSLIFAAPRCSDIPELARIRDIFEKKYGKDFVSAATDLRSNSGVNRLLIEMLSVRAPSGEVKLKIMTEIAKEHLVEWDATETEHEFLKPACESLNETKHNVGVPVAESTVPLQRSCANMIGSDCRGRKETRISEDNMYSRSRQDRREEVNSGTIIGSLAAAQAAVELAEKAIAQTALYIARQNTQEKINFEGKSDSHEDATSEKNCNVSLNRRREVCDPESSDSVSSDVDISHAHLDENKIHTRPANQCENSMYYTDINFDVSIDENASQLPSKRQIRRRRNYNKKASHSDIKFDDSDGLESDWEEDLEVSSSQEGLNSKPLSSSMSPQPYWHELKSNCADTKMTKQDPFCRVHPKLPDYDSFAAHFESLKDRRFS